MATQVRARSTVTKEPKPQPDLEGVLIAQLQAEGIHGSTQCTEPWSHTKRAFRADICFPGSKLVVEIQGGGGRGRHTTTAGFERDRVKTNLAVLAGWRVLEVTGSHVRNGSAVRWIAAALGLEENQVGWLTTRQGKASQASLSP